MSDRPKPQKGAGEAGQDSFGGSGASASLGGKGGGGSGLSLGGTAPVDDEEGGSGAGADAVAVPLLDATLCENAFVRVDQVPDMALFFAATFAGKPTDVLESADVAEPPAFYVFRFGSTHVEAISFSLYITDGPYDGALQVSAVDCGVSGGLYILQEGGRRYYPLQSAELVTVTRSVDGFSGVTTGSVSATWLHEDGEQLVLKGEFTLNAIMGDARVHF